MKTIIKMLLAGVALAKAGGKWTGGKVMGGVRWANNLGHNVWGGLLGGGGYIPTPAEMAEEEPQPQYDFPEVPVSLNLSDDDQLVEASKIKTFVESSNSRTRDMAFGGLRTQEHRDWAKGLFRNQRQIVATIGVDQLAAHLTGKARIKGLAPLGPRTVYIPVADLKPVAQRPKVAAGTGTGVSFTGVMPKKEPQVILSSVQAVAPVQASMENVVQVDFRKRNVDPNLLKAMSNSDERYQSQSDRRRPAKKKMDESDDMQTVFEFKPRFASKPRPSSIGLR